MKGIEGEEKKKQLVKNWRCTSKSEKNEKTNLRRQRNGCWPRV